ncbi:O-antigen ligase [Herbaspirillum sp. RV1423]|uniref:O-antigen ligase family protein n=1 Tax=Herbaspirillum sp. RV1423 TaxID=1443993 RepID=UPI0004B42290|nr:O-antigen ligase family protein [Herbaspirillum sp. RV1423]
MVVFTSVAVFLFSAIALVAASGFSLGAAMLVFGSLVLLHRRPASFRLERPDYLLIAALCVYFLINATANLVHAAPAREYDAPLRFALAIPALLLLIAYPPRAAAFWSGLTLGAIGAGLFAGWQFFVGGDMRAGGTTNPIQYGNISMVLGVLCLCGLSWAANRSHRLAWMATLCAGAMLGIAGSLFTGSRGSWLALPVCLSILAIHHGGVLGKRLLRGGAIAVCAVFAVLWAVPQSGLKLRTQSAVVEASDYLANGNADSSVGARLEMWRTGVAMLPGHWLAGWGKQGMFDRKAELVRQGLAAPSIEEHTHLHNEYLDALVKRGLPGLLAVLLLYLAPLALFARRLKHGDGAVRGYALGGTLLAASYLTFGLTQAFLTHNNGVMIFAFMTVILWAGLRARERLAAA